MSLNPKSETVDSQITDAEIWRCMETIEFNFGNEIYTVKEAGLLFIYETGIKNGQTYIMALSGNCGMVIFYIPDDIFELISKRAASLMCSTGKYIADLIELKDTEMVLLQSFAADVVTFEESTAAAKALVSLENALNDYYKYPEKTTNNWLKMHGFPMRRKEKGEYIS